MNELGRSCSSMNARGEDSKQCDTSSPPSGRSFDQQKKTSEYVSLYIYTLFLLWGGVAETDGQRLIDGRGGSTGSISALRSVSQRPL